MNKKMQKDCGRIEGRFEINKWETDWVKSDH